jgi:predicted O-linked N-acetylglucosamine transferase (SPINDLY family)
MVREAAALVQRGDPAGARRVLKLVLRKAPQHFDSLHLMGLIEAQRGHHKDAEVLLRQAIRINPRSTEAHANRGNVLRALERFADAVASYDLALALRPDYANAHNGRAIALVALERFDEALTSYNKALAIDPNFVMARYNRGLALACVNRTEEAITDYDRVLALDPAFIQGYVDKGNTLARLDRFDDAIAAYDRALAVQPRFAPALYNRGLALLRATRYSDALASFDALLAVDPGSAAAHDGHGNALMELGRLDEALAAFTAATNADAKFAGALNNRGYVLMKLRRSAEALACFDKALAVDPNFASALNNRGNALLALGKTDDALASFAKAAANSADPTDALANRGNAAMVAKQFELAIPDFERLIELKPDYPYALGTLFYCKMHCCDWRSYEQTRSQLSAALDQKKQAIPPFASIACLDTAAGQLAAATTFAHDVVPDATSSAPPQRHDHQKLRVGYLSWNFRTDPLSILMVELFERHDRHRFEPIAISYGPSDGSAIRKRLEQAFDSFHDVVHKSDREVAGLMRELEIDIAVDLTGFTENCRPGILALRPAPIQVNYLNYLGTMAVPWIDYVLADHYVMTDDMRPFFTECVAYLPDTFMAIDSTRRVASEPPRRADMRLPEAGVVFCCFNSPHKITPVFFDIWMRLLQSIDGSVLWLLGVREASQRNLRREAEARGVNPDRIVFMPRVSDSATYLARYRLADLFLDTLPYNAITTAVDALWAGLPVLTCRGRTLAGRGATSMLRAVGMPELITESLEAYEATALKLASDRPALLALKQKLASARGNLPLYDADRFRRAIEGAYLAMWARHERREPPADFDAAPAA